jgi:rhodanese-related sulfurtransferase
MKHRAVKDSLYETWAETAHALASPKRIELLDILSQSERTVEALAREAGLTVNNTSSHLKVLKAARLVETRKEAQFVFYRVADDAVVSLLGSIQEVARRRRHEVNQLAEVYLEGRDKLEPIEAPELRRRLKNGDVTLIDVRPVLEYAAGHIAGALSVPLDDLNSRLREIPRDRPVVAYCRGPYCVLAVDAVEQLRVRGYEARRFADGLPTWRVAGWPVVAGPEVHRTSQRPRKAHASREPRRIK